jgi:hypothetical protein
MKYSDVVVILVIAVIMFLGGLFVGMNYPFNSFTFTMDYEKPPEATSAPAPGEVVEEPAPSPSPQTGEPEPAAPEAPAPATQEETSLEWSGTGLKITENFVINEGPWAITWTSVPEMLDGQSIGLFKILVYHLDDPSVPPTSVANTMEKASETSYIEGTGKFFLIINGINTDWTVSVSEP